MPASSDVSRRLLLTGAAGLIGSRLATELVAAGWTVLAVDDLSSGWIERLPALPAERLEFALADVCEPGALTRLLVDWPCAHVVHLAARVGVQSVLRDPEGCRAANLRGVRELVAAVGTLPAADRPRVWAASSSEVYAECRGALSEDDDVRSTGAVGRWAYAASKLRGEQLLDEATARWGTARAVHLRFFNVVGPGQDADSGMVLPIFVERALVGAPLPVFGDGSQVRTFASADEVARTLRQLIESNEVTGGPLNLGGRARTSIRNLAERVCALAGSGSVPEYRDPRQSCGASFEEVDYREPELARLEGLGVDVPSAELDDLVADALANHRDLARPEPRPDRAAACASPAS